MSPKWACSRPRRRARSTAGTAGQHRVSLAQRLAGRVAPEATRGHVEYSALASNICPVPLPQWTTDAGGRGIALTYAIQSPSQLTDRWGPAGAETIWQASNCKVILGGLSVQRDLANISDLLGHRDELVPVPYHPQAHRAAPQVRRVPVMAPAEIREIREHHALVLYRSLRPVEIVMRPVWRRRDVRRAVAAGPAAYVGAPPAAGLRSVGLEKIVPSRHRGACDFDVSPDGKDPR